MCLAPRRLSPRQERARDASFVWLKGAEVGPPNLLQVEVEEQRERKLSATNMTREKIEF